MSKRVGIWALLAVAVLPTMVEERGADARVLSDLLALERVRWEARAWPETNPEPKPRFDDRNLERALRRRADSARRAVAALERFWSEPIGSAQIQAEIDRMARGTRDAALLSRLWSALGNDPDRIAESLA